MTTYPARRKETPSQTAGPYVHIGMTPNHCGIAGVFAEDHGSTMVGDGARGEQIEIRGRVLDGSGAPGADALLEIWQADSKGLYNSPSETRGKADPSFVGWGRCPTNGVTGEYAFRTIKPGAVPFPDGRMMAPHVTFWIVARGINLGLHTRRYFGDEEAANNEDPLLLKVAQKDRIETLVAPRDGDVFTFDIRLQGERETVFFDI
jgi:protocatechuate 3,4-dioxygenase alpha subunit